MFNTERPVAHQSLITFFFIHPVCYKIHNLIVYSSCSMMTYVVLFACRIVLNISIHKEQSRKNFSNTIFIVNLSDVCTSIEKVLDQISCRKHGSSSNFNTSKSVKLFRASSNLN